MQNVVFKDLGRMNYGVAWDYQESLLQQNVQIKSQLRMLEAESALVKAEVENLQQLEKEISTTGGPEVAQDAHLNGHALKSLQQPSTIHHLLFVEHPPVYTLGKSGRPENILISEEAMKEKGIEFYKTNRGGDITFHGPGQVVGYPILDLEKFYTDIGRYLRNLEEVIILTIAEYGLTGARSSGETGVWIEPGVKGKERKICAMGVRCSRWITMHGFAFNVNTDLDYFMNIIPCGIRDKSVTSLEKELSREVLMDEVKEKLKKNFQKVFEVCLS